MRNDVTSSNNWRDRSKNGWDIRALETLLRDCEEQPAWRDRADTAHAYYDGPGQLTIEERDRRRKSSTSERPLNLIARVINGVLGTQAKARRDVRVEADDEAYQDVSEAMSYKLKEAIRETKAAMAISNAYASMVKGGIGWVEVSRTSDPLDYPYRVESVHRNEIWWDWRCKSMDISRYSRWLCRGQWHDLDELKARLPDHADVLENMESNWQSVIEDDWQDERWKSAFDADRGFGVRRSEWLDGGRRRIKLYEIWYRVPSEVVVFRASPMDRFQLFDEENPEHAEAAAQGLLELSKRTTMQVRRALFAGPYRLTDEATKRKRFPYVPFIAFQSDADGTPYGLIEGMIEPQDGYNVRRSRVEWMLKAQQLVLDEDTLANEYNTIEDITDTLMRPDMVAVLNPNRRNPGSFQVRNDLQLQQEQWQSMQDDKSLIQDVPGVYSTMLGNAPTGVTAGSAISALVEQGEVALGELNDNLAFAETIAYESLLDMIADDMSKPDLPVTVGSGAGRRTIILNTRDEQGQPVNRVKDAPIRTGLAEVPMSPAYRQQQQQQLAQIIQSLGNNPQATSLLAPIYIESGSHPDRQRIADDLRRMTGLPAAGDKAASDQAAQQAQAQQQAAAQMQQASAQADLATKQARATLDQARAGLVQVETQLAPVAMQIRAAQVAQSQVDPEDQAIQDALNEALQPDMAQA